jgi:Flp pilus assembly protein TadD
VPGDAERLQRLLHDGRLDEAVAYATRALRAAPADPTLHLLLAVAHDRRTDRTRAAYFARRAIELAGSRPGPHLLCEAGLVLLHADMPADARHAFETAATLHPDHPRPLLGLATLHAAERRFASAAQLAQRALALAPGDRETSATAAGCLLELGRADEALDILRPLDLARDPALTSQLCCTEHYVGVIPYDLPTRVSRAYGSPAPRPPVADPRPDRPLTLGLVSPDLVGHSVAAFMNTLLARLDRERFRLICYSTIVPAPDHTTRRPPCDLWRDVPWTTTADLARLIRQDRVDILVDLSGHTAGHRLQLFQLRPAPLQVTFLGYPASTGLACFDARLVDSITDPPGAERFASEPLVRLDPCFLAYSMPASLPDDPPREPFTFASFNALSKLSPAAVRAWSRILREAPGTRLLLKAFALQQEEVRLATRARFEAQGVEPDRLELLPWSPSPNDHLALYRRVHLALDTFPYNGTTTTCEALSMGVPVLTFKGDAHAGRVGASLLLAAGMPELVADDAEDYAARAVHYARDPAQASELRHALARRLPRSVLADVDAWARRFESTLRHLWQNALIR